MLAKNFAEQGGGRRKADALQGRQRSYAEFSATDVKAFYARIVLKQMLVENFAERGGGRRNPDGFRGRQRSYAGFYATDVKGFY